jgi:hypothetical protein
MQLFLRKLNMENGLMIFFLVGLGYGAAAKEKMLLTEWLNVHTFSPAARPTGSADQVQVPAGCIWLEPMTRT